MSKSFEYEPLARTVSGNPKTWNYDYDTGRSIPMQVLVLGLPQTGTSAMAQALRILGYHDVYHMSLCAANPPDMDLWIQAIEAKVLGKRTPFSTTSDWNKLLGDCSAVTDFPAAAFAEELVHAYPHAKVILTICSVDHWYEHVCKTFKVENISPLVKLLAWSGDAFWSGFHKMSHLLWIGFSGCQNNLTFSFRSRHAHLQEPILKQAFELHYQTVRAIVPKERLLEMEVGEGWAKMCAFLEKPLPAIPYPRIDDKAEYERLYQMMINAGMRRLGWKALKGLTIAGVIYGAVWTLKASM